MEKTYPTVRVPDWSYFCDNLLRVHQTLISTRTHYIFCHFNSFLTLVKKEKKIKGLEFFTPSLVSPLPRYSSLRYFVSLIYPTEGEWVT